MTSDLNRYLLNEERAEMEYSRVEDAIEPLAREKFENHFGSDNMLELLEVVAENLHSDDGHALAFIASLSAGIKHPSHQSSHFQDASKALRDLAWEHTKDRFIEQAEAELLS